MKQPTRIVMPGAALLAAGLALAWVAPPASPADDNPSLERIKTLAGTWVALDAEGELTEEVVSSYRVIAGGSAVVEVEFAGTEKEMLTVYHLDQGELVLTHYCMLGNQPEYRAVAVGEDSLVFECTGGTNIDEDHAHMHEGRVTWLAEDRIDTTWKLIEKGENTYTAEFSLARLP